MPSRDLKDSNRRSPSLQLLSDAAERLWYRLITAVDDFGRMEADPEVVFTTCFQRVPKGWNVPKVEKCLAELGTLRADGQAPLIQIYQVMARRYLQICSAQSHIYKRATKSKYPDPVSPQEISDADRCAQVCADSLVLRTPNPDPRIPNPELKPASADADSLARFTEFWQIYPAREGKKLDKAETLKRFLKLSMEDQILAVPAARNYAESLKRTGISPRDPKRFLRDGTGCEFWREWIEPGKPDVKVKPKAEDPIPKAFAVLPRSTVQGTPMPEDFNELIKRVGKGMPDA